LKRGELEYANPSPCGEVVFCFLTFWLGKLSPIGGTGRHNCARYGEAGGGEKRALSLISRRYLKGDLVVKFSRWREGKKRDFVYIYIIAAKHNLEKGDLWLEMCLFVLLGAKTCLAANPFFVIRYSLRQYQL